jgi:hypothetical protein
MTGTIIGVISKMKMNLDNRIFDTKRPYAAMVAIGVVKITVRTATLTETHVAVIHSVDPK